MTEIPEIHTKHNVICIGRLNEYWVDEDELLSLLS